MADSILFNDLRTGRNGYDPPLLVPPGQVVEALNVDFDGVGLARRRGGTTQVSLSGGTAPGSLQRLFRFVPNTDETLAELWSFSIPGATVIVKRLAAGTTWADVTGNTLLSTSSFNVETTTLDGKLWIAAPSATGSRLLVYDPTLSSPQIRYVGFPTPAAPTVANTGSGTYAATLRYYRVRWLQLNGSLVVRRSEPGASVSFTPSGSGTDARVTRPTAASEQETHWEVEASADNVFFYRLAQVAIGTTTYDDNDLVSTYSTNTESADAGEYTTWTNVRLIISDGNRLIGAGSHVSGEKSSRIYFSAVLGATDQGDLERVPANTVHENFIDLNEKDGGALTGLAMSLNGAFYAFKRRQIWRISPTGDSISPYIPRLVTSAFGAISQASIVTGRDIYGNPAIYFWSEEGPCRIVVQADGSSAVQYLGEDIRDLTSQMIFTNASHTNPACGQAYPCAVFYAAKHQVWFWFKYEVGAAAVRVKAVFDLMRGTIQIGDYIRGGWSIHTDYVADGAPSTNLSSEARSAVMFAKTLGATMSMDLVPYVGTGGEILLRCDTTDGTDNSNTFQAYIRSRPLDVTAFGENVGFGVASLLANPASGVSIQLSLIRDYGLETRTSTVSLTAAASETKVVRKFEDAEIAGAGVVQFQLGDAAAVNATQWKLHELAMTVFPQEPR